jgi:citrate lyase subunit beta / citryl-CoA lyase
VHDTDKGRARSLVGTAVREQGGSAACEVHVRVNRSAKGYDTDDLDAVVVPGLAALRLPKAVVPEEVEAVAQQLDALERDRGIASGAVGLYPTIESAVGVEQARALAGAARVVSLAFGTEDFLADIGVHGGDGRDATLVARSTIVLASRAAAIAPPVDGAYTDLEDPDGLRRTTAWARSLGFFGRSAIHPRQLPIIHEVLTPSEAEIDWARRVVESVRDGAATAVLDGSFVDAPVVERAQGILAIAQESSR